MLCSKGRGTAPTTCGTGLREPATHNLVETHFCNKRVETSANGSMSDPSNPAASATGPAAHDEADADGHVTRREARLATNWIALIRLFDGTEIPCNVKDISKSGAKLGVPSSWDLPPAFMLKVVGRDFVMRVTLAWRRGNYAGVHIDRIAKLPTPVEAAAPVAASKPEYSSIGTRSRRPYGD